MAAGAIPDDPVALRSEAMARFFTRVMRRQMMRAFRSVRVARPGPPDIEADAPLVIFSNHPGWWDPALCIVLQDAYFADRQGYGPMEAKALEKYGFMRRIGIFGVEPDSRAGAARFMRVASRLLSDPARMLWLTPEGRFTDARERPVRFRPGLAHLMTRMQGAVAVPLAIEYPFWTEKRPEALVAFGAPVTGGEDVQGWQTALETALAETQDRLARAAMARDPAAFRTILSGARGVGGAYGLWGRLRDTVSGRRHDPDHLPESTTDMRG